MEPKMIFSEAKKTDLIALLAALGFVPDKTIRQDYWFKSPFRNEQTASFKVDRQRNIWYDHGEGKGGNVIDFAARFFNCDVRTAVQKLQELGVKSGFSFHPQTLSPAPAGEKKEQPGGKIVILDTRPLQNKSLLDYIAERKISLPLAQQYCKEVDFLLYGKQQTVIGFENKSGGFELRSATFKGSSSPKDITFLDNHTKGICVFEGFFNFLSFAVIRQEQNTPLTNCLVLNSLAFFEKSRSLMEQHERVYLMLDHNKAGINAAAKALEWNRQIKANKYSNSSHFYKWHEDLNDWLKARTGQQVQQSRGYRRGR